MLNFGLSVCSGLRFRLVRRQPDVSEENVTSIFRVENPCKKPAEPELSTSASVSSMLGLLFESEGEGDKRLRNVEVSLNYMALPVNRRYYSFIGIISVPTGPCSESR
jgi:hypothetical protein